MSGSISVVDVPSQKRFKVSVRSKGKQVTAGTLAKNFAPVLKVDVAEIVVFEGNVALSDSTPLVDDQTYQLDRNTRLHVPQEQHVSQPRSSRSSRSPSAGFVNQSHRASPSVASATAKSSTPQRKDLLDRYVKLYRAKDELMHELDDLGQELKDYEHTARHEASFSQPRGDSAASGIGEEAELEHQIRVVEALLAEDTEVWEKDLGDLKTRAAKSRQRTLNQLRDEREAVERETESRKTRLGDLASEVSRVQETLDASNRRVMDRRQKVDRAQAGLDGVKQDILALIERHDAVTQQDREMADYVAKLASEKHAAKQQLERLQNQNASMRESYENLSFARRKLHREVEDIKGNIRVVVRLRPFVEEDSIAPQHVAGATSDGQIEADPGRSCVFVSTPTTGLRNYEFYAVYAPDGDTIRQQGTLFEEQVVPLLDSVFDGSNSCVMAYGQTGSGKTFTIVGETPEGHLTGLLPQSVEYLFDPSRNSRIGRNSADPNHEEHVATVSMTMVELYMDTVYDLMPLVLGGEPQKCDIRLVGGNDGAQILGAEEVALEDWEHAMDLIQRGISCRQTHATLRNKTSSRSHLLLTLHVTTSDGHRSKLVFVDLAGSERVSRSLSQGERLKEAQHINKSLSALGDVVASLTSNPVHVPYRNSKLTQLLQSAIGGNAKTLMVTCICPHIPEQRNLVETVSTLTFASRAKLVRNTVKRHHIDATK